MVGMMQLPKKPVLGLSVRVKRELVTSVTSDPEPPTVPGPKRRVKRELVTSDPGPPTVPGPKRVKRELVTSEPPVAGVWSGKIGRVHEDRVTKQLWVWPSEWADTQMRLE